MRFVFNLLDVGLGNNGGSRTIIKCGEALASLGIEVIMYSNVQSGYTWHEPKGVKFVYGDKLPKCNILCATGYKSVKTTVKAKAKKKIYYIRGFELWQANENDLIKSYRSLNCIVNSEWLQAYLKKHGINSSVVYPGLDEYFKDEGSSRSDIFGSLFHKKHKTKRHEDAQKVEEISGYTLQMMNKYIKGAGPSEVNSWYNTLKVWFAPTESEGLHNPPMESALAGCALVCTNHKRSGMSDYAVHDQTALVYEARDTATAATYVSRLMRDEDLRRKLNSNMVILLNEKIGSRQKNMKRLVEVINAL